MGRLRRRVPGIGVGSLKVAAGFVALLGLGAAARAPDPPPPQATLFGLQPFPYDFTTEAIERVHELAATGGTLYAVHRDNGIPWAEALQDAPFPASVGQEWDDLARRTPPRHVVYLALAPLAEDRISLAPASKGSSIPAALRGARLDAEAVKTAYLIYARRAVQRFRPRFLNLGIEAGELAARDPARWPEFEVLYEHVRARLKNEDPELQIGISFALAPLRKEEVARRCRALAERSDYVGLSFYPYMSAFHEKFGAPPLPAPPAQWREPLAWARRFTTRPLALCETGYSSRSVDLPAFQLHLSGDPETQARYVTDLGEVARRERYLFVVWSMPVDYDRLYEKLPKGDGRFLLWRNIGLFDSELTPRPAWEAWKKVAGAPKAAPPEPAASGPLRLDFVRASDLFVGPPSDRFKLEEGGPFPGAHSMEWSFTYAKGRWQWCVKDIAPGRLSGRRLLRFWVRSEPAGPLFVQLEEQGGEAFFKVVEARPRWQRITLDLKSLEPDPGKRRDGRLDNGQVVKVLLADSAGALSGARGRRTVWLADWVFE